jgi:hypothetical protein
VSVLVCGVVCVVWVSLSTCLFHVCGMYGRMMYVLSCLHVCSGAFVCGMGLVHVCDVYIRGVCAWCVG